jgi:hypothetical protein
MIRLDLSYFYRLSLTFRDLRDLPQNVPINIVWLPVYTAHTTLASVYTDAVVKGALRTSNSAANVLHTFLEQITSRSLEATFTIYDKTQLNTLLNNFDVVFQSELAISDSYFVMDKPPFSTITLINNGASLFPAALAAKVPEALVDLQEAGKCLAFELATACGFHVMRAMESVLRRYWEVASGGKPHPKQRSIGVYLRIMKEHDCGNLVDWRVTQCR